MNLKTTAKYTLLGGLFGLFFPVLALFFNLWWLEFPLSFQTILQLHTEQPIHWIIDSAPLILGFFARQAGIRQEKIERLLDTQSSELNQTNRLQKTILQNATSIILTTDRIGQIQSYNPAAMRLLGIQTEAEWKNADLIQLVSYKDLAKEAVKLSKLTGKAVLPGFQVFIAGLNLGIPFYEAELNLVHQKGHSFPALVSVTPLYSENEKMTGCLVMAMDISQLKASESQLASSILELQKANQELDRFLYLASHDLRTPLRGISTLTDFIREDLGDSLTKETNQNFEMLQNRVVRMHKLLEAIQEYANVGNSALDEVVEINFDEEVERVRTILNPPPEFKLHYTNGGPTIHFDRKKLDMLLLHLIRNSIHHHHEKEGNITIDWKVNGHKELEVSIIDDGPGIDQRFHKKVFEVFQALHPKEKDKSVGAGLAIVKRIIEESGGKIGMNSSLGKGTQMTFTLPNVILNGSQGQALSIK